MRLVDTLTGHGWLRTRDFGSCTGRYELRIYEHAGGEIVGSGTIECELSVLVEARRTPIATLVLADNRTVMVDVHEVTGNVGSFDVIGRVPGF